MDFYWYFIEISIEFELDFQWISIWYFIEISIGI